MNKPETVLPFHPPVPLSYIECRAMAVAFTPARAEEIVSALSAHAQNEARIEELQAFARSFLAWSAQMRSIGRELPGMEAREREAKEVLQ